MLKPLNKHFAPKSVMPEKVIQFGEGNFLRAFVDWIIWNMDQKTNFNGSVVVVQPIDKGMVDWLNGQDCLYHRSGLPVPRKPAGPRERQARKHAGAHRRYQPRAEPLFSERCLHGTCRPA